MTPERSSRHPESTVEQSVRNSTGESGATGDEGDVDRLVRHFLLHLARLARKHGDADIATRVRRIAYKLRPTDPQLAGELLDALRAEPGP